MIILFFWQTHSTSRFDCSSNVQETIRVQDSHLLLPRSQLLLLERKKRAVTTIFWRSGRFWPLHVYGQCIGILYWVQWVADHFLIFLLCNGFSIWGCNFLQWTAKIPKMIGLPSHPKVWGLSENVLPQFISIYATWFIIMFAMFYGHVLWLYMAIPLPMFRHIECDPVEALLHPATWIRSWSWSICKSSACFSNTLKEDWLPQPLMWLD